MGLLAPLYALAALAIVGPIVLHLIRRQPQGQIPFSSLMFLRTSPPQLTRRSRLDNLLLLLLRGLALLLIALAFSRPYWRQKDLIGQSGPARTVALLVDVSASMRREEVWKTAIEEAENVLKDLSDRDQVALYTVDNQLTPIVSIEDLGQAKQATDGLALKTLVGDSLQKLRPTWNSSKLSSGLIGLAEQLNTRGLGVDAAALADSQIVLISDFHLDSGLDELQGYAWPKQIDVDLRIVGVNQPGNARASLMQSDETAAESTVDIKIRIENNPHSQQESFHLQWCDSLGKSLGPKTSVQVAAGQVRVVTMPAMPQGARQVELVGDSWSGDNIVFIPSSQAVEQRILFCGSAAAKDEEDLSYFLSQAPLGTSVFKRTVATVTAGELESAGQAEDIVALVIEPTSELLAKTDTLRQLAERGVNVIVVLSEQAARLDGIEQFLAAMLSADPAKDSELGLSVSESSSIDHAMIAFVDYRSPIFSTLADPRFNDFSKIRIWKHRQIQWKAVESADESAMKLAPDVLASLDDQSPWLMRGRLASGNIWLFASGWQTSESTFALSSKFIPVMSKLVDPSPRETGFARVIEVGESIELEDSPPYQITNQRAQAVESANENTDSKFKFDEPGLYNIRGARWNQQLAVQVAANESRLIPLDPSLLKQYGLGIERVVSEAEQQDRLRQLKNEELEDQQRLWKWLLVAGLGVLLTETFCAGLAARGVER